MKVNGIVRMFSLSLLVAGSSLMYAQDKPQEKQDTAKPEEARPEAAKPPMHDAANPPKQEMKPQDQDKRMDAKPAEKEAAPARQGEQVNRGAEHPAEHPAQHANNNAKQGGRIPDEKFHTSFGREHTVVINRPVVVEGQQRFQSGGYWFTIVDQWPMGWAYTDNCYIDYVDGEYFLFDLLHPGVRVALFVVL
jgi:hypothetical protein